MFLKKELQNYDYDGLSNLDFEKYKKYVSNGKNIQLEKSNN